ncbi:thioredoxin domain-containing protein [Glacieibacterium megasporae]|uniref:thioredoxin domain-containing protein n=1 Tax=Glacieibacterium megasporae TaxID=2835787 RepID=UPI001C1E3ED2|nr:thioredoxin domain-containing protein [Polymorphobacter megasporae]UAJ09631.1 DsbA family protein [Polymorphobacter megasporae]
MASAAPAKPAVVNTAKPAAANWLDVIVATPEGGFRQGNPNAKVKLLEFGSLTCPHCAAFARVNVPTLRSQYVATGKVSYEYRPFLLNGVDLAPALLVRCEAPAAAIKLIDAFYEQQPQWTLPFTKPLPDDVQKRLSALPQEQQISAFAANGGLDTFMANRGMPRAKFDACTSDKAGIAKLEDIRTDADKNYGLTAVPTFVINGKTVPNAYDWSKLKPAIDAAL